VTLSSTMAISGAAMDAFLFTKMNTFWVRVTLLALFNLFMGDYVEFSSKELSCGPFQEVCINLIFVVFFILLYLSTENDVHLSNDVRWHKDMFWCGWIRLHLLFPFRFSRSSNAFVGC
jgi:hypothetical protein